MFLSTPAALGYTWHAQQQIRSRASVIALAFAALAAAAITLLTVLSFIMR